LDTVNDLNEDGIYEVAAIVGSLRKLSFNRGLLRAAIEEQPDGMRITEVPIAEVPLFNDDIENQGDPPAVQNLKSQILASDAVLLITPEYNQSISGVMKNAIDWASRPYGKGMVLSGKPVAILGASSGKFGTARAQLDLRKMLPYLGMYLLPKPEIYIGPGRESFDEQSNLSDEQVRKRLREMLEKLLEWTKTIRAGAD
jgi:chromate reductase